MVCKVLGAAALVGEVAVLALSSPAARAEPCAALYRASEPEVVAELELKTDGRFHYQLAYGALDESADGRWSAEADRARLTSDPVTPPAFALLGDRPLGGMRLAIDLDLPNGISRQYFVAVLRLADGSLAGHQFGADAFEIDLDPHDPPVSVRIDLPLFALSSQQFAISPGGGHALKIGFALNDLGKVAFADTPLIEQNGALVLQRHERTLAFRRVGRCQG